AGEPLGHEFAAGELVTEATCTSAAEYENKCTRCGVVEGTIAGDGPLGHEFAPGSLLSNATCTETASYEKKCTRCALVDGTISGGGPLGHELSIDYSEPFVDATCTSAAVYGNRCTRCGFILEFVSGGMPLGHEYAAGKKLAEATCVSPAQYENKCTRCGHVEGRISGGELGGHSFVAGDPVEGATCLEPAVYKMVCEFCGLEDGTVATGKPLPHHFVKGEQLQEATCEEAGVYRRICDRCKLESGTVTEPPLGHDFVRPKLPTIPGSCFCPPQYQLYCTRCKEKGSLVSDGSIPEHSYVPVYGTPRKCLEEGKIYSVCVKCGFPKPKPDPVPPYGSHLETREVVRDPTRLVPGLVKYTCRRPNCGNVRYVQISPTGGEEEQEEEKPKDNGIDPPPADDIPGTGLTDPPGPDVIGPEGPDMNGPDVIGPEGPFVNGPDVIGPEGPDVNGPDVIGPDVIGPQPPITENPGPGNMDLDTPDQKPEGPITENPGPGPFVPNLPIIIVVTKQGLGGITMPMPTGMGLSAANPQAQDASGGAATTASGATNLYEGDGCVLIGAGLGEAARAPLTNNALASIIWQMCGEPQEKLAFVKEDVNASDAMIRWLFREGIYDTEEPLQPITRREFFAVLWRLARSELLLPADNPYKTAAMKYSDAMAWASAMKLQIGRLGMIWDNGIVMLGDAFKVFDLMVIG
ncbi:MAG: hypothetical protein IJH38_00850, partial [Clostridia bacterium]|nr:hypothetical protein [Clostridia bacterium]